MRQIFSITHREARLLHRGERNDVPPTAPSPENREIADKRGQLAQLLNQYTALQHVMPQWQNPARREAYARHMQKVERALEQYQRNSASLTLEIVNKLLDPNRDGQSTELPQLIRYLQWLETQNPIVQKVDSAVAETIETTTFETIDRVPMDAPAQQWQTYRIELPAGWQPLTWRLQSGFLSARSMNGFNNANFLSVECTAANGTKEQRLNWTVDLGTGSQLSVWARRPDGIVQPIVITAESTPATRLTVPASAPSTLTPREAITTELPSNPFGREEVQPQTNRSYATMPANVFQNGNDTPTTPTRSDASQPKDPVKKLPDQPFAEDPEYGLPRQPFAAENATPKPQPRVKQYEIPRKITDASDVVQLDLQTDHEQLQRLIERLAQQYPEERAELLAIPTYWLRDAREADARPISGLSPAGLTMRMASLHKSLEWYKTVEGTSGATANDVISKILVWYYDQIRAIRSEFINRRVRSAPEVTENMTLLSLLPVEKHKTLSSAEKEFLAHLTIETLENLTVGDVRAERSPLTEMRFWRLAEEALRADTKDATRMQPISSKIHSHVEALVTEQNRRRTIVDNVADALRAKTHHSVHDLQLRDDGTLQIFFSNERGKEAVMTQMKDSKACTGFSISEPSRLERRVTLPPSAWSAQVLRSIFLQ